ncbi:MAG TPA: KR domain-containing protein, partial [Trueperaceae bacterium]
PLIGVVHAAGVLADGTIGSLDAEALHKVMAPKVDGALNLHELTAERELSFFALFSSAAAALGNPGQGNYAAANAFMDALAHHRRSAGLPAISIDWGAWEQAEGMVADTDAARLARIGVKLLSEEEGLALLDVALGAPEAQLLPIRLDTAALRTVAKAGALPPILSALVRVPAGRGAAAKGALARMLAEAPQAEWEQIALDLIRGHIAAVLGHPSPQAVDPEKNFKDMGFDSLAAVELRNRLIGATGLRLPATVVFDHPTPTAVALYVVAKLAGEKKALPATPRASAHTDEPIAIVGMSCRYPGDVRSPEDLWQLVLEGKDAIGEFPGDRGWDTERLF